MMEEEKENNNNEKNEVKNKKENNNEKKNEKKNKKENNNEKKKEKSFHHVFKACSLYSVFVFITPSEVHERVVLSLLLFPPSLLVLLPFPPSLLPSSSVSFCRLQSLRQSQTVLSQRIPGAVPPVTQR